VRDGGLGRQLPEWHRGRRRRRRRSKRRSLVGLPEVGFSPAFMHSEIEIDDADVLIRDERPEEFGP
jgi:hypothetical protein